MQYKLYGKLYDLLHDQYCYDDRYDSSTKGWVSFIEDTLKCKVINDTSYQYPIIEITEKRLTWFLLKYSS